MKIIFDSEEQKAKFIYYIRFTCPECMNKICEMYIKKED